MPGPDFGHLSQGQVKLHTFLNSPAAGAGPLSSGVLLSLSLMGSASKAVHEPYSTPLLLASAP